MKSKEQINIINEAINKAKVDLKPLGFNFIFWGIFITIMCIIHLSFPAFIQQTKFSAVIFWVVLPLVGMVYTTNYNIKIGIKKGYETHIGRVIKIVWMVFGLSWILVIIPVSIINNQNPVQNIVLLLALTVFTTGLILKSKSVIVGGVILFLLFYSIEFYPLVNTLVYTIIAQIFGLLLPGLVLYNQKDE
ncbi:MAG: hypothetical protein P8L83_04895 [Flavobacteriaceae bacterium]|nr:hypothetical protein [Flavobacteriaceae bacterium]